MPEIFPVTKLPSGINVVDRVYGLASEFEGGYKQTRKETNRVTKRFEPFWNVTLDPDQWFAFLVFFRARGTWDAWHWTFPLEMYGLPGYGGFSQAVDDGSGYGQSKTPAGYGEGPVLLVRFVEQEFRQEYSTEFRKWSVATVLETV